MTFSKRKIEKGLKKKGFTKKNEDHKTFRYIALDGTETAIYTYCSHGASGDDIPDGLIATMARQCQLTSSQFKDLVNCPLSTKNYEKVLQEQSFLPLPQPHSPSR